MSDATRTIVKGHEFEPDQSRVWRIPHIVMLRCRHCRRLERVSTKALTTFENQLSPVVSRCKKAM
jgi:hypothetical protein